MISIILTISAAAVAGQVEPGMNDARSLVATIETLQQPIEDFRCEFEGANRFMGRAAEELGVSGDRPYESFSGVFIWKTGGDTRSESLHRRETDGQVVRRSLVVRTREQRAERYDRSNDASLGSSVVKSPREVNSSQASCLGMIFLIDQIKRNVADERFESSVSDDSVEGRALKVLNIRLKGTPGPLLYRSWIDLRRNGHVVHHESYTPAKAVAGRLDITLAPFKVGETEVWMPVSGEMVGFVAVVDKKAVVTKDPTSRQTISVVGGTMEFNKRPGPEVFMMKYKPGTPISDHLRKLTYEFGQQKVAARPTRAEVQKMLDESIAKAEEQKSELVVASPPDRPDWASWLAWGFGALVLVSSAGLWVQRRRH